MGASSRPFGTPLVYVGSTNGRISLYNLDPSLGQLSFVNSIAAGNYHRSSLSIRHLRTCTP